MKNYLILFVLAFTGTSQAESPECEHQAVTTMDMNQCIAGQVATAEHQLERYLEASRMRYSSDPAIVDLLQQSQDAWITYRETHCDAIYQMWFEGTIRGAMAGRCSLQLTQERTHQIWADYLTYMDSTPPILPKP